jgi:hypothetical protein
MEATRQPHVLATLHWGSPVRADLGGGTGWLRGRYGLTWGAVRADLGGGTGWLGAQYGLTWGAVRADFGGGTGWLGGGTGCLGGGWGLKVGLNILEKDLPLPGMEPRFLGRLARSLFITPQACSTGLHKEYRQDGRRQRLQWLHTPLHPALCFVSKLPNCFPITLHALYVTPISDTVNLTALQDGRLCWRFRMQGFAYYSGVTEIKFSG